MLRCACILLCGVVWRFDALCVLGCVSLCDVVRRGVLRRVALLCGVLCSRVCVIRSVCVLVCLC